MAKLVRQKVAPIDRGWSGGHPGGRKIGPPDPIGEGAFSIIFLFFVYVYIICGI